MFPQFSTLHVEVRGGEEENTSEHEGTRARWRPKELKYIPDPIPACYIPVFHEIAEGFLW